MPDARRVYALIALAAVVSHAPALWGAFIWLDHAHIEDGLALARSGEWLRLFAAGFAGTGFYRPLMAVSLSLDAAMGGAPWLYHATTLGGHAGAAVLTAVVGRELGLSRRAAWLSGMLFAVHPATSLVANAIAFRSESMIAVALLSLVVFHRRNQPLGVGLALLMGALTKETALVLGPLFILALEIEPTGAERLARRYRLRLWGCEVGALAVAVGLRLAFAPTWRAHLVKLSIDQAFGTRLASLARSASRILLPIDKTVCDSFATSSLLSPPALGGLFVFAGVGYLAYWRRGPAILLALSLLPSLQLVPIMRWWSPHYLYVPLAFAAMLAAEALDRRGERAFRVAIPIAAVLAVVTFNDAFRYRSDATFWTAEVALQPACREAHFYVAEAAREARRLEEAAAHYEQAVSPAPFVLSYVDRAAAWQNLGVVRLEQERFDDARLAFRAALGLVVEDGERRKLTHNLATAELRSGHAEEAARLLEREVERSDALPASIFIRARAVRELGRREEADRLARRLRALSPGVVR